MKIIFFGDCHNSEWLEKILLVSKKFDESLLICSGDIAATNTKDYLKNRERYSSIWKEKK